MKLNEKRVVAGIMKLVTEQTLASAKLTSRNQDLKGSGNISRVSLNAIAQS